MGAKRLEFRGQFETVVPAWEWRFLGNPRDRVWAEPDGFPRLNSTQLFFKQIRSEGEAPLDRRGEYRYSAGKRTGPAGKDDGGKIDVFPIDPETGFMVQGIEFDAVAQIPCARPPDGYWDAYFTTIYWPAGEACSSWMPTWMPRVPADPKDLLAQFRKGKVVPVMIGGQPGQAFRMTYNVQLHHCTYMRTLPSTAYAACVDGPQGKYTLVLEASTNVFDRVYPVVERAMAGFKLAPAAAKPKDPENCPGGLFAHIKGNGLRPYQCVSECPAGTRPSPPGDFPYKGARACMSAN